MYVALICMGDLNSACLSSSVGRALRIECVRRGFKSYLSAAFSLKKKLSQVLCCVVLLCLVSEYSCMRLLINYHQSPILEYQETLHEVSSNCHTWPYTLYIMYCSWCGQIRD